MLDTFYYHTAKSAALSMGALLTTVVAQCQPITHPIRRNIEDTLG